MQLRRLELTGFRSYPDLTMELPEGTTIFSGPNTAGKTNILEAIYLCATGSSFRATSDQDMVNWDSDFFRVVAEVEQESNVQEIAVSLQRGARKRIVVNDKAVSRSTLIGQLPVVLFLPQDLSLVFDSPGTRRRYLDRVLSQLNRPYLQAWQTLQRVLRQRNYLLGRIRLGQAGEQELGVWDDQLSEAGAVIIAARHGLCDRLSELLPVEYTRIAPGRDPRVVYQPNISAEELSGALVRSRQDDLRLGQTTVGPHRDDFRIDMGGRDVRSFASRGEVRSLMLSLKLIEVDIYREAHELQPVLLLDDVSSELDEDRRGRLMELIAAHQTFLTTTDYRLLEDGIGERNIYEVGLGELSRVG